MDTMDTRISPRQWYERGRTLRQAKMYDQALSDLRQVIHDPNYGGQAHTQVALCLRALGRHEEAIAALRFALDSSSLSLHESMHVLYLLGQSLESLGRYAEALEAYGWVRQEDATFLDVESRIKRLCGRPQTILTRPLRAGDLLGVCGDFGRRSLSLLSRLGKH
jgi:tetratricopeptide (TPR) repeat protein